jgi:TRAP-type C4-dicarboxylate transport system substrate-binding protein
MTIVMSVLELTDQQVLSLVRQLPARRKRTALLALAQEAQVRRAERLQLGEAQLRRAAKKRGLDWDRLPEDEREAFVNRLLHED